MRRWWIGWPYLVFAAACSDPAASTEAIAIAGPDQQVQKGETVAFDGSASYDTTGEDVTYHWRLAWAPPGSQAVIIDEDAGFASLTTDVPGEYDVRLLVYGPSGNSVPDSVIVTALNSYPVVVFDVADEIEVQLGATVAIDSTASQDPDGDPLVRYWTLLPPEDSSVRLESPSAIVGRFVPDALGEWRVWLSLSDGFAAEVGEVRVLVTEDAAP